MHARFSSRKTCAKNLHCIQTRPSISDKSQIHHQPAEPRDLSSQGTIDLQRWQSVWTRSIDLKLTHLGTPVDRVHMDSGGGIEDGPLRGLQGAARARTRARDKRACETVTASGPHSCYVTGREREESDDGEIETDLAVVFPAGEHLRGDVRRRAHRRLGLRVQQRRLQPKRMPEPMISCCLFIQARSNQKIFRRRSISR